MACTRSRFVPGPIAGRIAIWLVLLAPTQACYQYVPAAAEPTPGAIVRARLTPTGTDTVLARFGPGVEELLGTYLGPESGGVSLLVSEFLSDRTGRQSVWNEAVRLPRGGIAHLEQRELSRTRSVLFGAGLLAALSTAYVALDIGGRVFESDEPGEPGPSDLRSGWLVRIPVGFPGR